MIRGKKSFQTIEIHLVFSYSLVNWFNLATISFFTQGIQINDLIENFLFAVEKFVDSMLLSSLEFHLHVAVLTRKYNFELNSLILYFHCAITKIALHFPGKAVFGTLIAQFF